MRANLAPKAKAVIILGASSLIAGSVVLINDISTTQSIKDVFLEKKYSLINDETKWTSILKDYTEHIKEKADLKINNFEGGEGEEKEFKKQCEAILNVKFRVGSAKKLISKALWCVKEQTILDYLKKNNYSILKFEDTEAKTDEKKWDEKIKKYLDEDNKEKIPDLKIEKIKEKPETISEEQRKLFIDACKKLHELKHFKEKFVDSYKLASNWCAEKPDES